MSVRRRGYVAYLLRLWQVEAEEDAPWRASVESPQTGERLGFASLDELFAFLENEASHIGCGRRAGSRPPERSGKEGTV
jgi:hypothetical protein